MKTIDSSGSWRPGHTIIDAINRRLAAQWPPARSTVTYGQWRKRVLARRHPTEVTADRLGDHYEQYFNQLSQQERDYIGVVRNALQEIAEGNR